MMKKILILTSVVALVFPLALTGCTDRAEQQAEVKRLQTELTTVKAASEKIKIERDELKTRVQTLAGCVTEES
jgi:outer membrane murein-binding lipoprotein Lpp